MASHSPGRSFGSWYCQKKHPVITSDTAMKNTRPTWVHFNFILLVLLNPLNCRLPAGAFTAGVGLTKKKRKRKILFLSLKCLNTQPQCHLFLYLTKKWILSHPFPSCTSCYSPPDRGQYGRWDNLWHTNLLILPSTLEICLFFYDSNAVNSVPSSFCWVEKRRKHRLPSRTFLWLYLISAISAPIAHNSISSRAATGWWHHNPQIYSTKAVGQVLIPNPWESIRLGASPFEPPRRRGVKLHRW